MRDALSRGQAKEALGLLRGELKQRVSRGEADDALQQLMTKLDDMAARRRAAPNWREPTAAERRENTKMLNAWFAANGYAARLDEESGAI